MIRHATLAQFLRSGDAARISGPVAVILAEDMVEIDTTLRHHLARGFRQILLFAPAEAPDPEGCGGDVIRVDHAAPRDGDLPAIVSAVLPRLPADTWVYAGHNAEYLFYPFCETRRVSEMLAFHAEERRRAMLAYVVDLYPADLAAHPDGVGLSAAQFDRMGYFATERPGPNGVPKDRQLDFHGGLRWRFEEHVPPNRRRIDRIALFRARPGLRMREDFTFDDEEMNTYACPWHNSLTCAVVSFRAAKALMANPASREAIDRFTWPGSETFAWSSRQLMQAGLMEPGQWF
ncbi:MAG: hypothetical protein NXH83_08350 [Rhodobacteraceae bacterium]|nr:hypothetical protein [Paracoccaceae bacterium]